jgi:ABC-type Na+ efflux pump permease subunit
MRVISIVLKLTAIALGALLLVRALHTTEVGNQILRLVPHRAWSALNESLALEGAETTANAEIIVWLVVCLVVSAALVLGGSALLRTILRRRSQTRTHGD